MNEGIYFAFIIFVWSVLPANAKPDIWDAGNSCRQAGQQIFLMCMKDKGYLPNKTYGTIWKDTMDVRNFHQFSWCEHFKHKMLPSDNTLVCAASE